MLVGLLGYGRVDNDSKNTLLFLWVVKGKIAEFVPIPKTAKFSQIIA
jgi:hypothetical protein